MAVNNENLAKCATCTMLDDIRDADKQYQFAMTAMQAGDKELADMHRSEAMERLSAVKKWRDKAENGVGTAGKFLEQGGDTMKHYFDEWYTDLNAKVTQFKM